MKQLYVWSFMLVMFYIIFWLIILTIFNVRITENSPTFPFVWTTDNHLRGSVPILIITIFISFFNPLSNSRINNNTQSSNKFIQSYDRLITNIIILYSSLKSLVNEDSSIIKSFDTLPVQLCSYIMTNTIQLKKEISSEIGIVNQNSIQEELKMGYWFIDLTNKIQDYKNGGLTYQLNEITKELTNCKSKSKILYPHHFQTLLYIIAGFIQFLWVPLAWALCSWLLGTIMIIFLAIVFVYLLFDNTEIIEHEIYNKTCYLDASIKAMKVKKRISK